MLQSGSLSNIKLNPISTKPTSQKQSVAHSISQINGYNYFFQQIQYTMPKGTTNSHPHGMATTISRLMLKYFNGLLSTLNSKSGQPQMNSPISLTTSMNAKNATNSVMIPRDSERALYAEGILGNASNLAKVVESSLSSKEDSSEGVDDIMAPESREKKGNVSESEWPSPWHPFCLKLLHTACTGLFTADWEIYWSLFKLCSQFLLSKMAWKWHVTRN